MRRAHVAALIAVTFAAGARAHAQDATVVGEVILKEGGHPLGFTTVAILSQGRSFMTSESGKFIVRDQPPGEIRLRFKRIGYVPHDTVLTVAANDTARVKIEMDRLLIQLPAMMVSGKCTNETPSQPRPAILAALFDQVGQNAERVRLLAREKPFLMYVFRFRGVRNRDNRLVPMQVDTVLRRPVASGPYVPKQVIRRGEGTDAKGWVLALPELSDFADTAFTNNHCFTYAGQTRFDQDSVIQVDYEPVPWLNKDVDIKGSMYLRVDNYQLVGTTTKLNRIPSQFRASGLTEVTVRAKFSEFVSGVPVIDQWEMTNKFRAPILPRVEIGQVINLKWNDTTAARVDTIPRRR